VSSRRTHVVEAWDAAARTPARSVAIHPSGRDVVEYERSGAQAALEVMTWLHAVAAAREAGQAGPAVLVLDYGCGDGRVLRHLCVAPIIPCGYDTSPAMREAARAACRGAMIVDDLAQLGNRVDLAYSHSVFIHHTYADGCDMLVELAGVVRPGGILAVQIPLYDVAREPESWTDVGVWTEEQLEAAAAAAGCSLACSFASRGAFAYDDVGSQHHRLQVLRRIG
jgi:SAM-dependent methyltransferase